MPNSPTNPATYSRCICLLRRNTTRSRPTTGKQEQMGYSFSLDLFAAALATFVIDSYKYLLPDRDTGKNTVALLAQISQQLSNGSQISAQDFIAPLPPFQPSTSAIWINALWFLSLVVSLFCALLATLQQHWARRYLHRTQTQCAVHKRSPPSLLLC
ncbi:hypothetical protein EDB92DRAFT_880925 [Lactarius akahatsu]|uniref:DUF6535 domain-containing protein n=1 Tax=Lactarius akahatsu TaxID=416441 RepID=A0AAD4LFQ3_9AGAM|nr:hypothetical protein EDB92DRAFT_880925 [Lactarius akahatsu]